MLTITGQTLGRKKPLFANFSVPFPPDLHEGGDRLTLRDLIARIVHAEVAAFRDRQKDQQLIHALTARQIAEGAARGKIDMGGKDFTQEVDEESAVAVALEAFEDGIYLVVVDGAEQRSLDSEVHLQPDSRVTFIRLAMLAGG
jgi:hypothetical protein